VTRLIIRPEAERDLQDGYEWYETQGSGLGDQLAESVEAGVKFIKEFPLASPVVYKNVRRFLVKRFPYVIFYVVEADAVVVIAIFHCKRNPKVWKRPLCFRNAGGRVEWDIKRNLVTADPEWITPMTLALARSNDLRRTMY
jgi:plasmid stabilization system protein ParE